MKIVVRTIPVAGLEINETVDPASIGFSQGDLNGILSLDVRGMVTRVSDTVIAHTQVKTRCNVECSRCLESFEMDCEDEFDFDYKVDKRVDTIDLGEDIRQEVIMHYPTRVLCKADCKGLCPGCGANLNKEACKCKK